MDEELKVGDVVRIKSKSLIYRSGKDRILLNGTVGIISAIDRPSNTFPYSVKAFVFDETFSLHRSEVEKDEFLEQVRKVRHGS